jgi:hypothetical protein
LRIGVLVDSLILPAWVRHILTGIAASNYAELAYVIERVVPEAQPAGGRLGLLTDPARRRHLFYDRYLRWDSARHAPPPAQDPFHRKDCSDLLGALPRLRVKPLPGKLIHRFSDPDLAQLAQWAPDVLLRFGFNILRGPVLQSARYGVWSFHHGDNNVYRGGPAHFWELVERAPLTGVLLQVLTEELDGGLVLSKGLVRTEHGISLARNRFNPYWMGAQFVTRKLRELHERGWEYLRQHRVPNEPTASAQRIYKRPGNSEMFAFLAPRLVASAARRLRPAGPRMDFWRMAARRTPSDVPAPLDSPFPAGEFRWLDAPAGHFYADPFLLADEKGGPPWLFFEDFDYATGRGTLAAARLTEQGGLSDYEPVLTRPYHLSFPHVFRHAGQLWMIPEASSSNTVELLTAPHPAGPWTHHANLLESVRAVDTVVWEEHGQWRMFTCLYGPHRSGPELWLFTADALTGPWRPHPASPVSSSITDCRPGGAVVVAGGRRYRVSQDGSHSYGYRMGLHEIVALDGERYEERLAMHVSPDQIPGALGVHTYNRCPGWEVIDGKFPPP